MLYTDMGLPKAPVERIMRNAGAKKCAEGAVFLLADSMEELADELIEDAIAIAEENGHDVIEKDDVRKASDA